MTIITTRSFILPIYILYKFGIVGLVVYTFTLLAYYQLLKHVFRMEGLTKLDEFFLLDSGFNRSNIITVVRLDKIKDYDSFRNFVISRATQYPRTRHYLKKFCSDYFFTPLPPKKLESAISTCFIRNDVIKTNQDICDFVAKEQIIRDSLNSL